MKTKIILSTLVLLLACLTLNAFNSPINENSENAMAESAMIENSTGTVDLNGFLFEFLGVQYNLNGTSTWTYKVTGVGARRDLSHWKLKLFNDHNVTSASPNTWEVHVDPHFQYYGIKWDSKVRKNGGMKTFSFTLDGRYDVGDVDFGYKSGRKLFHGTISGPTIPSRNSISGTVFNDTNSNGSIDGVEGFLENIQVNLYDDANANGLLDAGEALIESKTTDGLGAYKFINIAAFNVVVETILPSNTTEFTYLETTNLKTPILLTANDIENVDFGIKRTQIIFYDVSGTVFDDDNTNGLNEGEAGLDAIEVKMYNDVNANGILEQGETLVATTTTNSAGGYTFSQIMLTHVIIEAVVPINTANFTYTATTDTQEAITMLNQDIFDADFGINEIKVINYNISGSVFDDNNGDGIKGMGEGSIGSVTLTLYSDNNNDGVFDAGDTVMTTTVTNAMSGSYNFTNVTVENTLVVVTVPTSTASFTYTLTTLGTQDTTSVLTDLVSVNFGIDRAQVINYNISGNVYDDNDESGAQDAGEDNLESVTVTLYADNNADGAVDAGDTVITSVASAIDGTYSFSNVTTARTIVEVTVPGNTSDFTYTLTTAGEVNTSSATTDITGVNFGINEEQVINYNISGTVFDDDNTNGVNDAEAGLDNVTVTLYNDTNADGLVDAGDVVITTTTSATDGTYNFSNVTAARSIVEVTVPTNTSSFSYTLTTAGAFDTSSVNTDVTGVDFGINEDTASYDITGTVFDDDNENGTNESEAGLSNVTVRLFDDVNGNGRVDRGEPLLLQTVTDRNGNYQFNGITAPFVLVQVSVPVNTTTFQYTPTSPVNVSVNTGLTTIVDFGINRELMILYNVSGIIFEDDNGNQIKDQSELFLEGINVTLYADINGNGVIDAPLDVAISSVLTDVNGLYSFTGIMSQNVIVSPTIPSNGTFTTPGTVAVTSVNTNVANVDFGIDTVATLFQVSGVVFDDDNRNGIADAGEGSVDGLDVEIYVDTDNSGTFDPNLDMLVAFTQTSNGSFNFQNPNYVVNNVPSGQVFIRIVIPAGNPPLLTYTATYDPDTGTANPDGVYPTIMTGNVVNLNFGIDVVDFLGTPRNSSTDTGLITNGISATTAAPVDVSSRLRLYPNPAVRQIAINAEEFSGDVTVEIYNDKGYKVMTTTVSPFGGELKVDVQKLRPGIYYVKFGSRNKVASKKFIKG